jgi:flavin-binding protein dodecin
MGSVYKIVEIVGTSEKSWEDAAKVALETASKSIEEIRIAEVNKLDIKVEKDARLTFRTKLDISFKFKKEI